MIAWLHITLRAHLQQFSTRVCMCVCVRACVFVTECMCVCVTFIGVRERTICVAIKKFAKSGDLGRVACGDFGSYCVLDYLYCWALQLVPCRTAVGMFSLFTGAVIKVPVSERINQRKRNREKELRKREKAGERKENNPHARQSEWERESCCISVHLRDGWGCCILCPFVHKQKYPLSFHPLVGEKRWVEKGGRKKVGVEKRVGKK